MAKANPIGLGILGLGRAGWGMHCRELEGKERMFRIVAGCDILPDRCERLAGKYGCRTYRKLSDLLADPNVEMVSVATRSCDHYAHTVAALKAGKHVFLEKPMCRTWQEAKRLKAAAAKAKGKLYVRHNRRSEPTFTHVRQIIASGILGEVFQIKMMRGGYSRRDDWQTLKRFGGGQLLNWGPHVIDHALRLLDGKVRRIEGHLARVAAVGDAEDHLKILLTGRSGCLVDLEISGGAALGAAEYLVWGTKGSLECSGKTIRLKYLSPRAKLKPRKARPGPPGQTFGTPEKLPWIEKEIPVRPKTKPFNIWDELYKAVRKGAKFPIELDEAIQVMEVISKVKKGTPFA